MLPIDIEEFRNYVAQRFIKGRGIEIGAGPNPVRVAEGVKVQYLDYLDIKSLKSIYPDLPENYQSPDIVDDGSILTSIAESSLNFIIANHVLEHVESTIKTLETWISKIRPDGILYFSIPHKNFCFDRDRPTTPLTHFIRDRLDGHEWNQLQHYQEFVELSMKTDKNKVNEKVTDLLKRNYRIHFHTWDSESLLAFLEYFRKFHVRCDLEFFARNHTELVTILRVGR